MCFFNSFNFFELLLCVWVFCLCICVCTPWTVVPAKAKDNIWCCRSRAILHGCGLACRCWDMKPGPLQEKQVFITTEPFHQAPNYLFLASSVRWNYVFHFIILLPLSGPTKTLIISCNFYSCLHDNFWWLFTCFIPFLSPAPATSLCLSFS